MPQSKELTGFYRSYLAWLDEGAPDGKPYRRGEPLCICLPDSPDELAYALEAEIATQFREAGLNGLHPFTTGVFDYLQERRTQTAYLNPKRIQWVREHCNP